MSVRQQKVLIIRERSFLARMAAWRLGRSPMAMVWGRRILLHGISREDFLKDERWLRHEMEHVRQYAQYGFVRFLVLYLWESMRNGYHHNRFERAARDAEQL